MESAIRAASRGAHPGGGCCRSFESSFRSDLEDIPNERSSTHIPAAFESCYGCLKRLFRLPVSACGWNLTACFLAAEAKRSMRRQRVHIVEGFKP